MMLMHLNSSRLSGYCSCSYREHRLINGRCKVRALLLDAQDSDSANGRGQRRRQAGAALCYAFIPL